MSVTTVTSQTGVLTRVANSNTSFCVSKHDHVVPHERVDIMLTGHRVCRDVSLCCFSLIWWWIRNTTRGGLTPVFHIQSIEFGMRVWDSACMAYLMNVWHGLFTYCTGMFWSEMLPQKNIEHRVRHKLFQSITYTGYTESVTQTMSWSAISCSYSATLTMTAVTVHCFPYLDQNKKMYCSIG